MTNKGVTEIAENSFTGPILLTSAGQSTDIYIAQTLLRQAGIRQVLTAPVVIPEEITSYYSAIILAVGGSSKGLGSAGLELEQELTRISDVIAAAKRLDIPILAVHVGGESRRGRLSDSLIQLVFESADAAIILSEGDYDDFMMELLLGGGIPGNYVGDPIDIVPIFEHIFQLDPNSDLKFPIDD